MPGNKPIQSIQRTFRILYLLAGEEEGMTPRQIAAALKIRPGTIYNFLRTLELEHVIERRESPFRYVLGFAMTELRRLDEQRHLLSVSSKVLLRTYGKMPNANFSIVQHDAPYTYTRFCVETNHPGVLQHRREYVLPPYTRASCLVFLAYSSPEQQAHYFRTFPFETHGQSTWKTRERLEGFLAKIRRKGLCILDLPDVPLLTWDENFTFRMSVPIFSPRHAVVAAVCGYVDGAEPVRVHKSVVRLTREAAHQIMDQL
ncbi:MAG: hypothetical protein B9S32_05740 [Verrucomicrobia bacterium Tous-C9LFEB]|nr:MAG: hypothetical protein B9S32_05740 [Verrucomicrobia bacterium Tous-C9LFEB]